MTQITIPEEHRHHSDAKHEFIKSHTNEQDRQRIWGRNKVKILTAISIVEFVLIVAMGIFLKVR